MRHEKMEVRWKRRRKYTGNKTIKLSSRKKITDHNLRQRQENTRKTKRTLYQFEEKAKRFESSSK